MLQNCFEGGLGAIVALMDFLLSMSVHHMFRYTLLLMSYSLPQKKVYTFVEQSTQNWGGPDEN